MNMFRLWRLFHRSGTRGTSSRTSALAIVAFASATAVFLTVLGGLHGFIWRASADRGDELVDMRQGFGPCFVCTGRAPVGIAVSYTHLTLPTT